MLYASVTTTALSTEAVVLATLLANQDHLHLGGIVAVHLKIIKEKKFCEV